MASPGDYGLFVTTTQIWDVASQLRDMNVNTPEFKELLVRMYMDLNRIALALNKKESGLYVTMPREFVDGNQWFSNPLYNSTTAVVPALRNEFRTVINFGALPNGAVSTTKSVAHNISINTGFTFTRIYGVASDSTGLQYIPLPFASPVITDAIALSVTSTNVVVTVDATKNYSNYTVCYIVLEYLKH